MRGRWVALAVCALGAAAAGVHFMLNAREANAPPTPQAYVSSSWEVVRESPGHRQHVGKLQLSCTTCHGATDGGLDRPGAETCARCHQKQAEIRHALGAQAAGQAVHADASDVHAGALSACTNCHGFASGPAQKPTDCIRCHSQPQGTLHAVATHATAPCTECHDVHENAIAPKPCTDCHTLSVKHGHRSADVATQCQVCHEVHASAHFAGEHCISCHAAGGARPVPHSATFAGGHTCASCHQPHAFDRAQTKACRECHSDVHPLAGHEKQGCTGCHAPHAVREKIEGGAVCVTCHKDIKLAHAGKQASDLGACLGCHVPHPDKPSPKPQACVSCHENIGGAAHSAHAKQLGCTDCHAPHAFHLDMNQTLCTQCHTAQVSALAKRKEHKDCTSCHQGLPHALDAAPLACGYCHQKVQSKVHQGHAECKNCHEPHQASVQLASCADCHKKEVALHPRGHEKCVDCHDQHAGGEKPGVSDCSLCHAQKKLSGLHREPKHLEKGCLQCHAAHGAEPPGDRKACLSCHEDRVNHQPEATRCDGCHTFIGARHGGGGL
jgi:hypothetical protein